MDEELLINLVFEHACLWDQTRADYSKHPRLKEMAWNKIAQALDQTAETCRNRWKNLRDTYGKNKKAVDAKKAQSGGPGAVFKVKWCHFEAMTFLNKTMDERLSRNSNMDESDQDEDAQPKQVEVLESLHTPAAEDTAVSIPVSPMPSQNLPKSSAKKRSRRQLISNSENDPIGESLLSMLQDIKAKSAEYDQISAEKMKNEGDRLWAKSMVVEMSDLPVDEKAELKLEIQALIVRKVSAYRHRSIIPPMQPVLADTTHLYSPQYSHYHSMQPAHQ